MGGGVGRSVVALAALWCAVVGSSRTIAADVQTVPIQALPPNARLAIWGDSITEVTLYPKIVEAYLLGCVGRTDVSFCVFGHSGETLGGPLSRASDFDAFHPTAASIFYGMNDTGYSPWTPEKGEAFDQTMRSVIDALKARKIEPRLIIGPTIVDDIYCRDDQKSYFRGAASNGLTAAQAQNIVLGHFRDIARADALANGCGYADVYDRMVNGYSAAKKVLGENYHFAPAGIHPGDNGHMMIACEVLKAFGCAGDIGTISVDLTGRTTATAGHRIISDSHGIIEIESTRYPFCVNYDRYASAQPESAASIMPFIPFQQDLNRLVLKVTHLEAPSANVTWGEATKTFTREQLAAGINLPEAFAHTPFDGQFAKLMEAVGRLQDFQNYMIKGTSNYFGNDAGGNIDVNMEGVNDLQMAAARQAAGVPVRHTIVVEPTGASLVNDPVILEPGPIYGAVDVPLSVPLTLLHGPAHFSATDLPAGVAMDANTGVLSGRPTEAGTSRVHVTATSAAGASETDIVLTIEPATLGLPTITSADSATATVGQPFSYQITAAQPARNYFVTVQGDHGTTPPQTSLPPGLTYDTHTGLFFGTPQKAGVFTVQLAAWNGEAIGGKLMKLTIGEK